MLKLKSNCVPPAMASVVTYEQARKSFCEVGFGGRRDGDDLVIFVERNGSGFYVKKAEDEAPMGRLYCDEGWFSDCWDGGDELTMLKPWQEAVDATTMALLILKAFAPEKAAECHGGSFIGRGFRQRHLSEMVYERLLPLCAAADAEVELEAATAAAERATIEELARCQRESVEA